VVDGALRAVGADPDLHLLLVGPAEVADEVVRALSAGDRRRVTVRPTAAVDPADTAVDAATPPSVRAVPRRALADVAVGPHSPVQAAVAAVAENAADAIVSAGETGATVAAAALGLGRWPGVRRPALAASLPAITGPVVLLDVGGSLDAGATTLAWHAALGAAYSAIAHAVDRPRVGLLSVGTEPGKGDQIRRAADPLLARQALLAGGRYVGLVEGHDVSIGERAEVIVTDGFTGNVLLKGIEGAYTMVGGPPEACRVPRAAALLGVEGTVVVCHGAAVGDDVFSGIALAAQLHRCGVTASISTLLTETEVTA